MEAVLKIVEECWSQPLRVGDLAELVGLSPVRLQHLFKQETGTSVRRSLLDRRLSEAKHLLISSNASVKEICFRVGFGDQANFQASFKKRFGLTPRAFRLAQRRPASGVPSDCAPPADARY